MATRTNPSALPNNDSNLASWLVGAVVVLVGALVVGGYWMKAQKDDQAALRQKAEMYQNYLRDTRTQILPPETPSAAHVQAQETRQYLLSHPAVTPGAAFDKPGVQATGKAIVQAIDQAKGL